MNLKQFEIYKKKYDRAVADYIKSTNDFEMDLISIEIDFYKQKIRECL